MMNDRSGEAAPRHAAGAERLFWAACAAGSAAEGSLADAALLLDVKSSSRAVNQITVHLSTLRRYLRTWPKAVADFRMQSPEPR
jgi:hypothetical protein